MGLFVFALCLAGTFEIKEEARPPHKAQHMLLELKWDMTVSKTHTHVDFKWAPEENYINDQNETSDQNNLLLFMQMLHENILSESSDCPDNLHKSGSEGLYTQSIW